MSLKERLKRMMFIMSLGMALSIGSPLDPMAIDDLMRQMNQPKIAQAAEKEADPQDSDR